MTRRGIAFIVSTISCIGAADERQGITCQKIPVGEANTDRIREMDSEPGQGTHLIDRVDPRRSISNAQ